MSSAPPSMSFDNTIGALLIGNVLAGIFFGITSVQTYLYFGDNRDGKWMRYLIGLLWGLDILHILFCTMYVYNYAVTNFGNPAGLMQIAWTLQAHIITTGISDAIVRGIFIWRVTKFGGSKWLAVPLVVLIMAFLGGTFAYAAIYGTLSSNLETTKIAWIMDYLYADAVLSDIVLSVSLCYYLGQHKSRTFRQSTNRVLRNLMLYSINTGALVGLCTIAELVLFAAMPTNFVFQAVYFLLPELYLNALLACLNARRGLGERDAGMAIPLSVRSTDLQFRSSDRMGQGREVSGINVNVKVDTTTTTDMKIDHTAMYRPDHKADPNNLSDLSV